MSNILCVCGSEEQLQDSMTCKCGRIYQISRGYVGYINPANPSGGCVLLKRESWMTYQQERQEARNFIL